MIEILIKRLSNNISLPKYETDGSSGLDLAANIENKVKIEPGKTAIIPTGISVSIPINYEIQIRPRSGLAAKYQISILNTPGTIDADYRGDIGVILINHSNEEFVVKSEDRIAQLVISKFEKVDWETSNEINSTSRGDSGFGSTGSN